MQKAKNSKICNFWTFWPVRMGHTIGVYLPTCKGGFINYYGRQGSTKLGKIYPLFSGVENVHWTVSQGIIKGKRNHDGQITRNSVTHP